MRYDGGESPTISVLAFAYSVATATVRSARDSCAKRTSHLGRLKARRSSEVVAGASCRRRAQAKNKFILVSEMNSILWFGARGAMVVQITIAPRACDCCD